MEIKELYDDHIATTQNFENEIASIKGAKDVYTPQEIERQVEEKTSTFYSAAQITGDEIVAQINDFRKNNNYNSVAVDNPTFLSLLQSVQVFGKDIPKTLLDTAVFKLKNEQGTLLALKELFKAKEIYYPRIDEVIIENELIDDAIIEASQYNKNKPLRFGNIKILIDSIERLKNFTLPEYQTPIPKVKNFF